MPRAPCFGAAALARSLCNLGSNRGQGIRPLEMRILLCGCGSGQVQSPMEAYLRSCGSHLLLVSYPPEIVRNVGQGNQ